MDTATWRVLLIEDDEDDAFFTRQLLAAARREKFTLRWAKSAAAGRAALAEEVFDAVLVDYHLGPESGLDLVRRCASASYPAAAILLTGRGSYDIDLQAMEAGASDYLAKQDLTAALLERSIRYAIEHKRAEGELRHHRAVLARERELLQTLIDRIPVMIVTYRVDLQMMQFNQAFEQLTGWTTADAQAPGVDLMEKFYPDPAYRAEVAEYMARLDGGWRDFVVTTRDGRQLPSRWANIRLNDQLQIGVGIDITDQARAEQALRASEERFRLASRAVAGIVYDWDLATGAIFRTEGLRQVIGLYPQDVPDTFAWWIGRIHPDDRDQVVETSETVLAGQADSFSMEYRVQHEDGHWVHVWDRCHIVRDPAGKVVRVVGTAADISARKELELALSRANAGLIDANRELSQANQALSESEGLFRIALGNAPMTVFTQDRDLRYTWIYNPFPGHTEEQVLHSRDDDLFPPHTAADLLAAKRSVIETGQPVQRELNTTLNGQNLTYLLRIEPLYDESGAIGGLRGAGLDLSELRQLEAAHLERANQLELHHRLFEQREMERQRIARDLHDGPIQDLLGMIFSIHAAQVSTAELGLAASERERRMEAALQTVRWNIQDLVGDLRGLCNELRPPALVQLGLEQAIRSHAETVQMKNDSITIHLDLPRGGSLLPDHLRVALFRIYQEGINNILRHANASEVFVRLAVGEGEASLEIVDDGQGFALPPDWMALARDGHLGLVGMKERAEAAGGTFAITSQPGQGASVRVSVPLQ